MTTMPNTPPPSTPYHWGIDVDTRCKNELIRRLDRLVSTVSVSDGGEYHQDRSYSQVHVVTHKTEEELEQWLYLSSGEIEYTGVFALHKLGNGVSTS